MRLGSTRWHLALPSYALTLLMVLVYAPPSLAAQSNLGQAVSAAGIPALIRSVLENVGLPRHTRFRTLCPISRIVRQGPTPFRRWGK